jgi:hypothetical protein
MCKPILEQDSFLAPPPRPLPTGRQAPGWGAYACLIGKMAKGNTVVEKFFLGRKMLLIVIYFKTDPPALALFMCMFVFLHQIVNGFINIIAIFTLMALSEFKTPLNMARPCSVKALGK